MLKILFSKHFLRQYKKLSPSLRLETKKAIDRFRTNPQDKSLKSHKLSGKLKNYYSFSVDYKTRVVFEFGNQKSVILLKVGSHDVYK